MTQSDPRREFVKLVNQGRIEKPRAVAIELKRRGWDIPKALYVNN